MSGSIAQLNRSSVDYDFTVAADLTIPLIYERLTRLKQRFFTEANSDDLTGHRLRKHFDEALAYIDDLPDCYSSRRIVVLTEEFLAMCPDICQSGKDLIRRGLLSPAGPDGISPVEMRKTGDKDPK